LLLIKSKVFDFIDFFHQFAFQSKDKKSIDFQFLFQYLFTASGVKNLLNNLNSSLASSNALCFST